MAIPNPLMAKYLFSPENGIVCINTELKRRMCPWMIPCNKLDASDIKDDPHVTMVYSGGYDSRKAEEEAQAMTPEEETVSTAEDSFRVLKLQVESSEDPGELRQIGADLGVELARTMRLKTMKKHLMDRIEVIEARTK